MDKGQSGLEYEVGFYRGQSGPLLFSIYVNNIDAGVASKI